MSISTERLAFTFRELVCLCWRSCQEKFRIPPVYHQRRAATTQFPYLWDHEIHRDRQEQYATAERTKVPNARILGIDRTALQCSIIPAFKNIKFVPADPLSQSVINDYISKERTIFWPQTPSDHWAKLGPFMQKYLAGVIGRDELLKGMKDYWMKQK
jgi:hypothetical protein